MRDASSPFFDFALHTADIDEQVDLIQDFAGLDPYRSAQVEELVLDEDFYRRPLRPEDLSSIRFDQPVTRATTTMLPTLASQRLLLSINELDHARLPDRGDADEQARYAAFYGDRARILGTRIRPFLEAYAFDYLNDTAPAARQPGDLLAAFNANLARDAAFWGAAADRLLRGDYLTEGLRFILIQRWSLLRTKRIALARAEAAGYFDAVPAADRPRLSPDLPGDDIIAELAIRAGVTRREHSYWQFYLSSSLAACNLLHAMAARPDRALRLLGAAFAAEAEWIAFGCFVGKIARHFASPLAEARNAHVGVAIDEAGQRFARAVAAISDQCGPRGLAEIGRGLAAADAVADTARQDLGEQLRWLSSLDAYVEIAHAIDRRIQAERPDIDRETFVEPREMCSTTHVHDDHRLVVIETGDMVFWGNVGMKLTLKPGEMVLVPQGRLHGSSIESDECVYHQPIIPEDWIDPLVERVERFAAAS
jgi:mannose-6-phosphate isomerase-like protein (cupin superfamily)